MEALRATMASAAGQIHQAEATATSEADRVVEGILLTSDYITVGTRAWVRLWITGENGATAVLDPTFEPYFYAVPAPGAEAAKLAEQLEGTSAGDAEPARCEVATLQEGLEEIAVVRVVAMHPQDVPALRRKVRKLDTVASTREDDVLFANRYLIDEGLRPLTHTRVEVNESERMPGELEIVSASQAPEVEPELHVLAFDLEVYNPKVTPDPARDPIVVASIADNQGHEEILTKPDDDSDRMLVATLAKRIRDLDPDVIVTYNGDDFDWPYLVDRATEHGIDVRVGRDGSPPKIRQAGRSKAVTVTGRGNVDGYQMAQRDLPDVKVKTLERVAEHLGVLDQADRANLDSAKMAAIWDDPARRETLLAYALDDATSALGIAIELMPLQVNLCRRTYQDLSDGSRMGRGRQADWYLLAEANHRGILAPDKRAAQPRSSQYEGGVVLEPPAGIHEDVVYLDFSSMYPSIMVAYNISPDTYVPEGIDPGVEVVQAPDVGHRFRSEPDGFFKRILQELITDRRGLKERMRELEQGSQAWRSLKVEEQAVKVLTNAFYGYMGWAGARWQSVPCAEATTAFGRHFILRSAEMAEELGLEVLYGDTDSVMVLQAPNIQAYIEAVNEELPVELEVEATFDVLFFTGAKKRYAGRTTGGQTIVRGLEVRRGDWCTFAKDVQQKVIDALLEHRDPSEAKRLAIQAVQDLRDGKVALEDLTIHKTLTMDPSEYQSKQPHSVAVERARQKEPDFQAPVGSKIGYVIVQDSSDLISERARMVEFLDEGEQVDADYYIENQVVPAAHRVLGYFGIDEDELAGRPSQSSLGDWM